MTTATVQSFPNVNLPYGYINGLVPFCVVDVNDVPTTTVSISSGQCRDSDNKMDISLGVPNVNGDLLENYINNPLLMNLNVNGINGLDTGEVSSGTVYRICIIGDSTNRNPTAALFSLQSNKSNSPLYPKGYDSYRVIGFVATGDDKEIKTFYISGNQNTRKFTYYDVTPIYTDLTNPFPASIFLDDFIPFNAGIMVDFLFKFTPVSAGDSVILTAASYSTYQYEIEAQVNSLPITQNRSILSVPDSIDPTRMSIMYEVTAGSLDVTICGYDFTV